MFQPHLENPIMKKLLFTLFAIICLQQLSFAQKEINIDGVIIPRYLPFENKQIELNGIGKRNKLWFDVYTLGLYLTKLSQDPKEILDSNTLMGVRIQITSSLVSSKKFSKSINDGIEKSAGKIEAAKFKNELNMLEKYINSEKIVQKDVFNLIYNPVDSSMYIIKNDVIKGKIPGFEFKKAFYGIWLCDKPINQKLKNDLLGK